MIDGYLSDLEAELRRRRMPTDRRIAEVREHLVDATAAGVRSGLPLAEAKRVAIERMGPAAAVAEHFADDEHQARRQREAFWAPAVMGLAVLAGLCIAYVDSRPHWDDTGITVFLMLSAAFVLGFALPRWPWLWAVGIGAWIPLGTIVRTGKPGAAVMFVIVLFPMAGAYAGAILRKTIRRLVWGETVTMV